MTNLNSFGEFWPLASRKNRQPATTARRPQAEARRRVANGIGWLNWPSPLTPCCAVRHNRVRRWSSPQPPFRGR